MMLLERTDLISNRSSNHCIRALIQTLSGMHVEFGDSKKGKPVNLSHQFTQILYMS